MTPIRIPLDNVDSRRVLAGAGAVAREVFVPLAITTLILVLVAFYLELRAVRADLQDLRRAPVAAGHASVDAALNANARAVLGWEEGRTP